MSRARLIPAIDALLARPGVAALAARHGAGATRNALREAADRLRADLLAARAPHVTTTDEAAADVERHAASRLDAHARSTLQPVLNATGIVIHTNLGRAPLCADAIEAMADVARGYATLEFELETGGRG